MSELHTFNVSVIIPVYNAAVYVERAVYSALDLPMVKEIILVDDAYPDGALEICKGLASRHQSKVRVLQHEDGRNRGPGASRNLGIKFSKCEFVAFLDADDWYLPNRFDAAGAIFTKDSSIDGVYDATGFYYEDLKETGSELTTLPSNIAPNELFVKLVEGNHGYFHTNSITVRKSIFDRAGYFNEGLKLHQDTHLWLRFAFVGKLVGGNLTQAVSIRRVHAQNRIAGKNRNSLNHFYQQTFSWFAQKEGVDRRALRLMFFRYVSTLGHSKIARVLHGIKFLIANPSVILKLL